MARPDPDRQVLVVSRFEFAAAHCLPHHAGKCRQPHGHNYVLEIGITAQPRPADGSSSEGMVLDFADLRHTVHTLVLAQVDHRDLNGILPPDYQPSTVEHLALWVWDTLQPALPALTLVRIWETSHSYAEVRR